MSHQISYHRAIALAQRIAAEVGEPLFYLERTREVAFSRKLFADEALIAAGLRMVEARGDCAGHGISHVKKVAVDSGALILIEAGDALPEDGLRRQVLLVQLAGLFHDIRRTERNHAEQGAKEAERLLASFSLREGERESITGAIRNHEAFRPCRAGTSQAAQLLSDALYDADKFRWGPDNFTETLWAMIIPRALPIEALLPRFQPGLDRIRKIRESFRTPTGRKYGPDFIDRGLTIGRRLHAALTEHKAGEPT
jgi:hypothetical protein